MFHLNRFFFRAHFRKVNFLNCLIHLNLKIIELFVIEINERGSVLMKFGNLADFGQKTRERFRYKMQKRRFNPAQNLYVIFA